MDASLRFPATCVIPQLAQMGPVNVTILNSDGTPFAIAGVAMAIDGAVAGGVATRLLYVDGSGNLQQDAGLTFDGNQVVNLQANAGAAVAILAQNSDATVASYGRLGAIGVNSSVLHTALAEGDATTRWTGNAEAYAMGYDRSANKLVASYSTGLGTNDIFRDDGTTFEIVDILKINNVLNAVTPTAPNRTITLNVGGTTVYVACKTTND